MEENSDIRFIWGNNIELGTFHIKYFWHNVKKSTGMFLHIKRTNLKATKNQVVIEF